MPREIIRSAGIQLTTLLLITQQEQLMRKRKPQTWHGETS
jgi:hypothetical protein